MLGCSFLDGVEGWPTGQDRGDVVESLEPHLVAGLSRRAGDMRGQEDVRQRGKAQIEIRLTPEHTDPRRKKLAGLKRLKQRVLVHEGAAGRVHEHRATRQKGEG